MLSLPFFFSFRRCEKKKKRFCDFAGAYTAIHFLLIRMKRLKAKALAAFWCCWQNARTLMKSHFFCFARHKTHSCHSAQFHARRSFILTSSLLPCNTGRVQSSSQHWWRCCCRRPVSWYSNIYQSESKCGIQLERISIAIWEINFSASQKCLHHYRRMT